MGLLTNVCLVAILSPFLAEFMAIVDNRHSGLHNARTMVPASDFAPDTPSGG
jgi:hypothetical protein